MDPKSAALFVLVILALIVVPTLILRYRRLDLRHRERMVAFDRGVPVPPETVGTPPTVETYQLRGLIWLAAGIALSIALSILMPVFASLSASSRLNREQDMKRNGFSYLEIREAMKEYDNERQQARAYAVLGLVPAAVGAAYLFFYYDQKRRYLYDPPSRPVKME